MENITPVLPTVVQYQAFILCARSRQASESINGVLPVWTMVCISSNQATSTAGHVGHVV